jgi:hypothetical protein
MFSTTPTDRTRRLTLLGLASAAVVLVTGCGDGRVRVSGTVMYEGKPLELGIISFEPADGVGPTTGGPITDGEYDLTGNARSTTGEKIVRIVGSRKSGRKLPAPPPSPPGTTIDEMIQCIPKEYNEKSRLKVQITPGTDNIHDFELPLLKKP